MTKSLRTFLFLPINFWTKLDDPFKNEVAVPLPSGNFFVIPSAKKAPDYVRFASCDGVEIARWDSEEWQENPDKVMAEICADLKGNCKKMRTIQSLEFQD